MYNLNESKAGYSLVEVTLALLVVAIGITSTFALFPEAMKNTRTAVNDNEVALFADYVFSTLAAAAAVNGPDFTISQANNYATLALSPSQDKMKELVEGGKLSQFYWVAKDDDQGTGDWEITSKADFWSTAFSYKLEIDEHYKGRQRCTIYATLKVWPGEWTKIEDENKFKPFIFYREILPYPTDI